MSHRLYWHLKSLEKQEVLNRNFTFSKSPHPTFSSLLVEDQTHKDEKFLNLHSITFLKLLFLPSYPSTNKWINYIKVHNYQLSSGLISNQHYKEATNYYSKVHFAPSSPWFIDLAPCISHINRNPPKYIIVTLNSKMLTL